MGAVAVDSGGDVWWLELGGRLHRRGAGVIADGIQAVAVAPSGMLVLGRDGRLGSVDDIAAARAHLDQLPGALDLAIDETAGIAYAVVAGAVLARSLTTGTSRTLVAVDASALVLSPDRRRLYVADRGAGRILAVATADGAVETSVSLDEHQLADSRQDDQESHAAPQACQSRRPA